MNQCSGLFSRVHSIVGDLINILCDHLDGHQKAHGSQTGPSLFWSHGSQTGSNEPFPNPNSSNCDAGSGCNETQGCCVEAVTCPSLSYRNQLQCRWHSRRPSGSQTELNGAAEPVNGLPAGHLWYRKNSRHIDVPRFPVVQLQRAKLCKQNYRHVNQVSRGWEARPIETVEVRSF